MPQVVIEIKEIVKRGDLVSFVAQYGQKIIKRTLAIDDVKDTENFATWLINQTPDAEGQPLLQRTLTIDYHTEETEEGSYRVVDGVSASEV